MRFGKVDCVDDILTYQEYVTVSLVFKSFSFLFLSHFGHIRICFSPQFCLIACFKYFIIKKWLLKVSLLLSRLWYLSSYLALFLIMFSLESLVCYDLNEYVYLVSRDYTTLMEHIKKDWTCNSCKFSSTRW